MTTAAVYARISKDAEAKGLGVARQEQDCRALCERKGWAVGPVHVDNSISATRKLGRIEERPGYSALVEDVKAGRVQAVVAYNLDRLGRDVLEQEEFFLACELAGMYRIATIEDDIDISTGAGLLTARIKKSVAAEEARRIGERTRRALLQSAEQGRFSGGPRPYGYVSDGAGGLVVVPEEAQVVRDAAERVLAGESPYAVCVDLNAQGVTTSQGAKWRPRTLRRTLASPTVAGMREHQGEIIGAAAWEPILDEMTWRRLVVRTEDLARTKARPPRAYLLTGGLARCGKDGCGAALVGKRKASQVRTYVCSSSPDDDGCGRLSVAAEPLEALVTEAVIKRLDSPALAQAVTAPEVVDPMSDAIAADEAKLAELADMWDEGQITRAEWLRLRAKVERRLEEARRDQAKALRRTVLLPYGDGGSLRAAWPGLTLEQRRAVVAAVVERVTVGPGRPGPRFDEGRVDVTWRV